MLTARLLADDAVCAVPAGPRLPQAAVALDPEAGVGRQHGRRHLVRLPVAVGHLLVLAPHQASACSGHTSTTHTHTHAFNQRLSAGGLTPHIALKLQLRP